MFDSELPRPPHLPGVDWRAVQRATNGMIESMRTNGRELFSATFQVDSGEGCLVLVVRMVDSRGDSYGRSFSFEQEEKTGAELAGSSA